METKIPSVKSIDFEVILKTAAGLPGVRIEREDF